MAAGPSTNLAAGGLPVQGSPGTGGYTERNVVQGTNLPANARGYDVPDPMAGSQQLAAGLQNVSQTLSEFDIRRAKAHQDLWMIQQTSADELQAQKILQTATHNVEPGKGITDAVTSQWDDHVTQQQAGIENPDLQTRYAESMANVRKAVLSKAQEFDQQEADRYATVNFGKAVDNKASFYNSVTNYDDVDGRLQNDMGEIGSTARGAALTPESRFKMTETARKNITDAANEQKYKLDPARYLMENSPASAFDGAVDWVMRKEGGFVSNDGGKGPTKYGINSEANPGVNVLSLTPDGAKKIYQDKYWQGVGADKMSPDLALVAFDGAVNQGIGATKELLAKADGDPQKLIDLRRDLYAKIASSNPDKAKFLPVWNSRLDDLQEQVRGFAPHPSSSAAPDQWQGDFKAMTGVTPDAAGVKDKGEAVKFLGDSGLNVPASMQDAGGPRPIVGSLSFRLGTYEQQQSWLDKARVEKTRMEAEQAKNQSAYNAAFNSDFEIGLNRGDKSYTDIEGAYRQGLITPSQRTEYTKKLDEVNGLNLKAQEGLKRVTTALSGDTAVLDPKNSDDKKAVDNHFKAWEAAVQNKAAIAGGQVDPVAMQAQQIDLAGRYGMVPETMQGQIRASLRSTDAQQIAAAADTLDKLRQKNPELLNDFADEDIRAATNVQAYVAAGFAPAQAIQRVAEAAKVPAETRKVRETQFTEALKKTTPEDLLKNALTSWWPLNPNYSNPGTIPGEMQADYTTLVKAEYTRTGNMESAQKVGAALITKTWGPTGLGFAPDGSSGKFWMKNPPEKWYSAPTPTLDYADNGKWMREQLTEEMQAGDKLGGKQYSADKVMLMTSPHTLADGRPTYFVFYKDDNGVVNKYGGENFTWHPDWQASKERSRLLDRERRRASGAVMVPNNPLPIAP